MLQLFIDYRVYPFGCNGGRYMYFYGYHLVGTINENNFIKSTGNLENCRYLLIKINSYYKK